MSVTRPARFTPPQRHALTLLGEDWRCETAGVSVDRFHKLLHYPFRRGAQTQYVSGTTLEALRRRALLTWEPALLTFAYDGSQVPGHRLQLTDAGSAALAGAAGSPKE